MRRKLHKTHAKNKKTDKLPTEKQQDDLHQPSFEQGDCTLDFEKRNSLNYEAIWKGLEDWGRTLSKTSHHPGKPPTSREFRDSYRKMIRDDNKISKTTINRERVCQEDCTKTTLTTREKEMDA